MQTLWLLGYCKMKLEQVTIVVICGRLQESRINFWQQTTGWSLRSGFLFQTFLYLDWTQLNWLENVKPFEFVSRLEPNSSLKGHVNCSEAWQSKQRREETGEIKPSQNGQEWDNIVELETRLTSARPTNTAICRATFSAVVEAERCCGYSDY